MQVKNSYKGSELRECGAVLGSFVSKPFGGVGCGYQMPSGEIVASGGNGWFYPVEVSEFTADGGLGYKNAIKKMFGGK